MSSAKPALRKELQKARLALTEEDRHTKSEAIAASLLRAIKWPTIRKVHCFEPIMRLGEVDLVDFVVALQTDREDIRVYTSRKFGNEWQIVDAATDQQAVVLKFDAIIVPMLGFDASLHRLGYGGGYYDKFLAEQSGAKKIGVCYELGKVDQLPSEPHDVALDIIITESHTYTP